MKLAKEGVHIIAFDIAQTLEYPGYKLGSENELTSLKQACEDIGISCLTFSGNVRIDEEIAVAVKAALSQFNRIWLRAELFL